MTFTKNLTVKILQDEFETLLCKSDIDFSKINKKIVLKKIYYVGKKIAFKNLHDGKRLPRAKTFLMFLQRVKHQARKILAKIPLAKKLYHVLKGVS